MKPAYRMFRRKNRPYYYIQNNSTCEQRCLHTSDKTEAKRFLDVANHVRQTPALNLQLGKAYIAHADPAMATALGRRQSMNCVHMARMSAKNVAFGNLFAKKPIIETTSEDLKTVLQRGSAAANNYLRRLHNLALGNGWMQWHT